MAYSASSYMLAGDIQTRDFVPPTTAVENGSMNNYRFQEQQLQAPEAESILEDNYAMQSNGSVQNSVNALQDHLTPVEEAVGEPQSILMLLFCKLPKGNLHHHHLESILIQRVHPLQT